MGSTWAQHAAVCAQPANFSLQVAPQAHVLEIFHSTLDRRRRRYAQETQSWRHGDSKSTKLNIAIFDDLGISPMLVLNNKSATMDTNDGFILIERTWISGFRLTHALRNHCLVGGQGRRQTP